MKKAATAQIGAIHLQEIVNVPAEKLMARAHWLEAHRGRVPGPKRPFRHVRR